MPAGACVSLSKIVTASAVSTPRSPRIDPSDAFTTKPPSSSGWAFSICASNSTTCAPGAGFTPVPQYSAAISGGLPGAPTTASARVTRMYVPTSLTAVLSIARGVC